MKYFVFVLFITLPLFARNTGEYTQGMKFPCISPDNKELAFSFLGDIWISTIEGKDARRITIHQAYDSKPRWSPDGTKLAFNSTRSGNSDVWVVPRQGGIPIQLTHHSSEDSICGWSSDGQYVIFASQRSGETNVWKMKASGGIALQITQKKGNGACFSSDMKTLLYAKGSNSLLQKSYIGSANWDIWSLSSGSEKRWTTYSGNDLDGFFLDNHNIIFVRETLDIVKNKYFYNFWRSDGKTEKQLTHFTSDVRNPYLSLDKSFIVFEKDFCIWKMEIVSGKSQSLPLHVYSDNRNSTVQETMLSGNEMGHWSPNGKTIAFCLNGDIWLMPVNGGVAEQVTTGNAKDQWPRFSPDGKYLAYFSNANGNNDIFVLKLEDYSQQQITQDSADDHFHSWSPDSKQLLFTSERSGNRDIWIVGRDGQGLKQLTFAESSEDDAVFSPDGTWIAFDSNKNGTQQIWLMPSSGNYDEAYQLTKQGSLTQVPTWSPDSRMVAFESTDASGTSGIWVISSKGGKVMPVVTNATTPCWSPDGKYILHEVSKDDVKTLHKVRAPQEIYTSELIPFSAQQKVNKKQKRLEILEEMWEKISKDFYDEKFHGVDWHELKARYSAIVPTIETEDEFYLLLNQMLGEIGASHMGISSQATSETVSTGYLGWTLQPIPGENRGLQIGEVISGGPIDQKSIQPGEYVFQLNGVFVTPDTNIAEILNDTIGSSVKIFVSPENNIEKGRYVTVIPVGLYTISNLRYQTWIKKCENLVESQGNQRILYVHLVEMEQANVTAMRNKIKEKGDKYQAMILDLRGNIGGWVHQELLQIFSQKPFIKTKYRRESPQFEPQVFWNKPVVVVINEESYSDSEVFTFAFKHLQLGVVVGETTAGGVIGTQEETLSNGAILRVPKVGYYGLNSQNLEGLGVKPDFFVRGNSLQTDEQLLKAIQIALSKVSANGARKRE